MEILMSRKLKTAVVQFNHYPGQKAYNMEIITSFVRKASENKVDLVVFPEMCITGYWHVRKLDRQQVSELAESVPEGPASTILFRLSRKYNISIGAGLIEVDADGKLYNSYIVTMPDGNYARHRKIHCFINEYMASGDDFTVFSLPDGTKAGILICYDNNIIENARINALLGAEILIAPHQTGGCVTPGGHCMGAVDVDLWEKRHENPEAIEAEFRSEKGRGWLLRWLPSRAHDNGMFVLFSNGVGKDDNEVRTGNSMIIDPFGTILSETWKAGDEMVTAELDLDMVNVSTGRRWIRTRRPELYSMLRMENGYEDTRKVRFENIALS